MSELLECYAINLYVYNIHWYEDCLTALVLEGLTARLLPLDGKQLQLPPGVHLTADNASVAN